MIHLLQFLQECSYKYNTVQYTYGKKDIEKLAFSADVQWHCDSSKKSYVTIHTSLVYA